MTARQANIPQKFLGNSLVNTFPQQRINMKQRYCWKWGVSMWTVPRSYLEDNWGDERVLYRSL
jgi:hypothetical protein